MSASGGEGEGGGGSPRLGAGGVRRKFRGEGEGGGGPVGGGLSPVGSRTCLSEIAKAWSTNAHIHFDSGYNLQVYLMA